MVGTTSVVLSALHFSDVASILFGLVGLFIIASTVRSLMKLGSSDVKDGTEFNIKSKEEKQLLKRLSELSDRLGADVVSIFNYQIKEYDTLLFLTVLDEVIPTYKKEINEIQFYQSSIHVMGLEEHERQFMLSSLTEQHEKFFKVFKDSIRQRHRELKHEQEVDLKNRLSFEQIIEED